jgi:hypothetical protein
MSLPVIEEKPRTASVRIHKQIQRAVTVNIRKGGPASEKPLAAHAGNIGDLLKAPIPKVPEKVTAAFQAAKEKIAQSIPIHIAGCDAAPTKPNLVFQ